MAGRNLKEKLLDQAKREYSPKQRFIALAFEAVFFLVILPAALVLLGWSIDRWLGISKVSYEPFNLIFGVVFILLGWLFAIWSIYAQFTVGRGTPVPLMATQKLVIQPPYSYCRNPMALGAIVLYLGVAIRIGSLGALILVLLGAIALLTYIKRIEEKEMEIRFGQDYLDYKDRTPFLIPRFTRKG